ncbi:MAG TPA: 2-phospho-L-lactate transferase CofD family protein, partial [Terriglobales bacterium]|nr:2-phospho-L-lactate transferase CofD family protein [Terriglobales bacterium]
FVRLHQEPEVREVRFEGVDAATVTPEVREAFRAAETIVVAPSNPIVSIGPILAVPGLLGEIAAARARGVPAVGVSGIVRGKALRGPADRMLATLGDESSALGVARRYAAVGLLDVFVIDRQDEALADTVRAIGLEVVVTDTIMTDGASRAALAQTMVESATARAATRRRP